MTNSKHTTRHVKITPQEMDYEGPSSAELKKWRVVGRGRGAILGKPADEATVVLAPDVAEVFPDSKAVNEALRGLLKSTDAGSASVGRSIGAR